MALGPVLVPLLFFPRGVRFSRSGAIAQVVVGFVVNVGSLDVLGRSEVAEMGGDGGKDQPHIGWRQSPCGVVVGGVPGMPAEPIPVKVLPLNRGSVVAGWYGILWAGRDPDSHRVDDESLLQLLQQVIQLRIGGGQRPGLLQTTVLASMLQPRLEYLRVVGPRS